VPLFAVLAVLVPAVAIAILSAGDLSFLAGIEYMPAQQFLTTGSPAFDVDACISLSVFACASARFSSHAGATRTPAAKHCRWLFIQWFHISFPFLILIGRWQGIRDRASVVALVGDGAALPELVALMSPANAVVPIDGWSFLLILKLGLT
jgi:hypothetical protein